MLYPLLLSHNDDLGHCMLCVQEVIQSKYNQFCLHKSSAVQHAQCTNLVLQLSNNLTDIEQHYVDLVRCEQHETALKVKECMQHYCEGEDQGQFNQCSG